MARPDKTLTAHDWPAEPVAEYDAARRAFFDAVAKGKDGRPEYVTLRTIRDSHAQALEAIAKAQHAEHANLTAKDGELSREARRLGELAHRIGTDMGGRAWRQADHDQAVASWRSALAEYTGQDESSTPVEALSVPMVQPVPVARVCNLPAEDYAELHQQAQDAALRTALTARAK
jgi:hypothetical protein